MERKVNVLFAIFPPAITGIIAVPVISNCWLGVVVPMPTLPLSVILIASVKAPLLKVEKAKSPFPVVQFWVRIPVMAAVEVEEPRISEVLKVNLEAVEVAEAKLVK